MYLIGLFLILIFILTDFVYKYIDLICYQLKIFNEKLQRNRY